VSDFDDERDDDFDDDDFDDDDEDDDLDDDDFDDEDDDDDEVGAEGNRIVGARSRAVVEHVARHLVDDPDALELDVQERPGAVTILLHAGPGDMGRLIGKRGRVIQAMRQVARAAGATEGVKATVDVVE
jgi:predicted RNA-binding protein YlqC (UPF0109 family)